MKSKLKRLVRKHFSEVLVAVAPEFQLMPALTGELADIDVYSWRPNDEISLFLMFQPDQRYDCFYVEAAFSGKHLWPSFVVPGLPDDAPHDGELRFRITRLWDPKQNFAAWWIGKNFRDTKASASPLEQTESEQVASIPKVIENCRNRIVEYVIPYFQRVIQGIKSA